MNGEFGPRPIEPPPRIGRENAWSVNQLFQRIRRSRWFHVLDGRAILPSKPLGKALLASAIVVALTADFFFFTGFFASDDAAYLFGSRQLTEGVFKAGQASTRLGITLPDAAIYSLAGGEIAWISWFHVLYHLGLVALAFHLGRLVADERVGLVAAGLAALQPLYYVYAGAVLPDNAMSLWLGVHLIVLETAGRRRRASPGANWRLYAAAGLLIGVAYSCKETALIMTIPSAICVAIAAPQLRSWDWVRNGAWMAAGLVGFVVVEGVALWVFSGEPQWRLGFVSAIGDVLEQKMAIQGVAPWQRFAYAGHVLSAIAPLSLWGLVAACVAYVFVRRRSLMLLAFFWWPAIYLTIGSTSFTHYRPPTMQPRYYAIALLPALVMAATLLVRFHEGWGALARMRPILRGRLRAAALSFLVAGVAVYEVAANAPRAGNIYWGLFSRGFAGALEVVRDEYPQYPVLLEPFYRSRMRPLLFPQPPEWFSEGGSLMDGPPAPPFLYLERLGSAEERRRGKHGGTELASAHGLLRVRTLRTVYPAATRWDVVRDGLGRLFAVQPRARVPPSRSSGGVALQLVTLEPPPAPVPELFSLDDRAAAKAIEDGVYYVSWGGPESRTDQNQPPRFYIQTFDRWTYRRPSDDGNSRFPVPVPALSVDTGYRLVQGDRVRLQVHLYGYDATGGFFEEQKEVDVTSHQDKVIAHLELSSEAGLLAYKVRTRVIPSRKRGGLQVFAPVVRTSVTNASSSPRRQPP